MAAIDSKCNHSLISPEFASQCKLEILPFKHPIHLGIKGMASSTLGITKPIQINWGPIKVTHAFIVAELNQKDRLLIGVDLFKQLGIQLAGLPLTFPTEEVRISEKPKLTTEPSSEKLTESQLFMRLKSKEIPKWVLSQYRDYLKLILNNSLKLNRYM